MPVNTVSAAVHITPVAIKTFYKHYKHKAAKFKYGREEEDSTDDFLYDEAFHIVKAFIELGTHNTVESLQAFTNTHIFSPPTAAVSTALVPLKTCNQAADLLISWFDPEDLQCVVGGERWWQVRGLDGVEAEWVTERKFLRDIDVSDAAKKKSEQLGRKLTEAEHDVLMMDNLDTVMLYVHGGAYFWGSINTHRYQIIKYSRKIAGRVFAVNYRKAPQYPWPCPLHDTLAAYLYLTNPPPTALHSPVPPSKIVVAGDSAGAGLCVSLLTVLRDLGKPLPAGGVLISPWVDLTHSFPSVMENTATDIIPPHGFIHKPSMVWPVDARPPHKGRIAKTETLPPPKPGHADTLKPNQSDINAPTRGERARGVSQTEMMSIDGEESQIRGTGTKGDSPDLTPVESVEATDGRVDRASTPSSQALSKENDAEKNPDTWEPKPPKVLMEDPNATPLELHSQIQLYATNEQLTNPLVSPVFQGSLGNLCPLYIICGNDEALRDEIIYLAHRAACPDEFSPRMEAVKESKRQLENLEKFRTPTKVHLQVFDGMCHVLTVFTFHTAVKYAYRSIAEFVKHVTERPEGIGFPELKEGNGVHKDENASSDSSSSSSSTRSQAVNAVGAVGDGMKSLTSPISEAVSSSLGLNGKSSKDIFEDNKAATKEQIQENPSLAKLETPLSEKSSEDDRKPDFSRVVMIRERVDVHGRVRQMEPKGEIPSLRIPTDKVGLLREAPARRWLEGQQEWDRRYKSVAKRVESRRRKIQEKYEKSLERARELGFVHLTRRTATATSGESRQDNEGDGTIQQDIRWGPLDLDDEDPPPSAIAARRDTPESLALLRKTLYYTAPRTTRRLPKRRAMDVVRAAFDPSDDPSAPPKQSVSEQQRSAEVVPMHGLNIWAAIMT